MKRKKIDKVTESRTEVKEAEIEVDLHKEKVNFISNAYEKSLQYWKSAALMRVSENEASELIELAQRKVILASKAKNEKFDNIEEIIFYLKCSIYDIILKTKLLFQIFRAKSLPLKQLII